MVGRNRIAHSLLSALMVFLMLPLAHASAAKESPRQEEEGVILVGTPDCSFLTRNIYQIAGQPARDVFTHRFDVDPKTWHRPFVLEPRPGIEVTGTDLMIIFYFGDIGSPEDVLAPPPVATYVDDPGGEKGIVPKGATDAFILFCQGSSVPTHPSGGLQAGFHYLAEGPKKPL